MTTAAAQDKLDACLRHVEEMAPLVREFAEQADRDRAPAREVIEAASARRLFRLLLPEDWGGAGLGRDEVAHVFEAMARIDGSMGWLLAISQDRISRSLSLDEYKVLYADPNNRVAGSLNTFRVRAERTDGGFIFSGIAPYVSGCTYATWLSAAALWIDNGERKGVTGIFPMSECTILDTWNVVGLRGTGSHDVQFADVFVPDSRIAKIGDALDNLVDTLAPVALGVAQHALDAFHQLAQAKVATTTRTTLRERPIAQLQYGQAVGTLKAARALYYASVADGRRIADAGQPPTTIQKAEMRLAAVTAADLAAKAVDLVFDAAGLTGPATTFELERCWRDIHTLRQHVLLSTPRYELVGRILLGLDSNSPII
jgi:alkylation response protein AidB-like acyl-CoA dehydrogenase